MVTKQQTFAFNFDAIFVYQKLAKFCLKGKSYNLEFEIRRQFLVSLSW